MVNELDLKMTRICDAVRDKTGVTGKLNLDTIAENIEAFEGGGAEIETCTVRIENTRDSILIIATTIIDGNFKSVATGRTWLPCEEYINNGWTISNVLCGSTLAIIGGVALSVNVSDGVIIDESGERIIFQTPSSANTYVTISPDWD